MRIDGSPKELPGQISCLWPTADGSPNSCLKARAGSPNRPSRSFIAVYSTSRSRHPPWLPHRSRRPRWRSPPQATRCEAVSSALVVVSPGHRGIWTRLDHMRTLAGGIRLSFSHAFNDAVDRRTNNWFGDAISFQAQSQAAAAAFCIPPTM